MKNSRKLWILGALRLFFGLNFLGANLAFAAELLTPNHSIYTQKESEKFAFDADESGLFQNPPPNKARIYAVRGKDFVGERVNYELFYQYEPRVEPNIKGQNELVIEPSAYESNVLGILRNASAIYSDFEADKPLLLLATLETNSYIVLTPRAGRIYCVQSSVILGLNKARPNLKLINKAQCEEIYKAVGQNP